MRQKITFILLVSCTVFAWPGMAQLVETPYNGLRISLFDFKLLQNRGRNISLKFRVANTGRTEVGLKKNNLETVVELDTANLPSLLWGHERELAAAAAVNIPRLKPGEISSPIWVKFSVRSPEEAAASTPGSCPDLVLDTAYITGYSSTTIDLCYILRNAGTAPVVVANSDLQLALNIYFISGTKLTRGAIPAGNTVVMLGRETITGWLQANQKLLGAVQIDLKNRTKFAQNLLLELAPPANLIECDRTNNTRCVEVKY